MEEVAKTVSRKYVWMPVSVEQALGNRLHSRLEKDNKILERNVRRNRPLYHKADAAHQRAKKDYTNRRNK